MIPSRSFRTPIALLLALALASAVAQGNPLAPAASTGFEVTFDGSDPAGAMEGILTIGTEGPWTGTLTGSAYELRNDSDAGAVRYHYLLDALGVRVRAGRTAPRHPRRHPARRPGVRAQRPRPAGCPTRRVRARWDRARHLAARLFARGSAWEGELERGTRASSLYAAASATEAYRCSFGLAAGYVPQLEGAGLVVSGVDESGEARIVELRSHPFFLATLFAPQRTSRPHHPHPLSRALVSAATPSAAAAGTLGR